MKARLINENFTENYVINLLKFYGIKDIENYLTPNFNMLQSPLNLDNIHEGYKLLKSKCENNEHILRREASIIEQTTNIIIGHTNRSKMYVMPEYSFTFIMSLNKYFVNVGW